MKYEEQDETTKLTKWLLLLEPQTITKERIWRWDDLCITLVYRYEGVNLDG